MHSYLHSITRHEEYIEKVSLWIKIKQKNLETHGPHPCLRTLNLHERRGAVTAHFRQESRYPDRKSLIYL